MALSPLGVHVRPYRDYLTPALHRRFSKASRYTLLLCYVTACVMGEWDNPLWLWFPIGPTGIRTLLLFLPALVIYVLRVAQWHVGQRQTLTRAETFNKYFSRKSTLLTLVFYAFSAWLYGEVYIWSRTSASKLGFTDIGRAHERLKLNERPLFLRFLFLVLAVVQTGFHLWDDYDSIDVPAMKPKKSADDATVASPVRRTSKPRQILFAKLPSMVATSGTLSVTSLLVGTIFYFIGPRSLIWDYYYSFNRYFISLSKTSRPTGLAPFMPLVFGFAAEGTMLVLLWQFVNRAFDLYIAQEPLKNDQPITADSKDPNGTLLNGLKSKKDAVRAIAFWELALITDSFPDRRKTVYGELERKKAPTFQQVTDTCLGEVKLLIERLSIGLDPSYSPKVSTDSQNFPVPVNLVPQITQPLKTDKQIVALAPKPTSHWEQLEATTAGLAKSHSSPGNAQQAYGREAINKGKKKAKEGAYQAESLISTYWNWIVSSWLGYPFRQSLQRTASLVVLGAPYSRSSLICNATTALTNLASFSLKQDELGRFHEGVPQIIRTFTMAIQKLDEYMAKTEIHWSDFETLKKPEADRRKVPQVDEVRECLREGLERILGSFNEFLGGMGLSKLEAMEAKKAIGTPKGPEMLQTAAAK
ncbi:nucleoporin protein Ndc1-Nup [Paraphoma chrysanthemicola]|nr:nucleoporin protein Ndc1-Nup [Paraphoma chrysanthemicola]